MSRSKDRLAELNQKKSSDNFSSSLSNHSSSRSHGNVNNYNNNYGYNNNDRSNVNSVTSNSLFLDTAEKIRRNIEKIQSNTQHLNSLHRRALAEIQNQSQILKKDIHQLSDATNQLIQSTRADIKGLTKINGESQNVKITQQKSLAKKLMDTAREFQVCQNSAKRSYKQQMERQYKIACPNASQEQIRQAVGDPSGRMFQQELVNSRFGEQRAALEQVQSRNHEIELIEQSIEELFNLFQDMQLLLDTQQERIEIIDSNVDDTVIQLDDASKQLTSAISSAKSARAKKWCLCIFVLILIAVIAVVIYIYAIKPSLDAKPEKAPQ